MGQYQIIHHTTKHVPEFNTDGSIPDYTPYHQARTGVQHSDGPVPEHYTTLNQVGPVPEHHTTLNQFGPVPEHNTTQNQFGPAPEQTPHHQANSGVPHSVGAQAGDSSLTCNSSHKGNQDYFSFPRFGIGEGKGFGGVLSGSAGVTHDPGQAPETFHVQANHEASWSSRDTAVGQP
jgi:hypothetical protein